MAATLVALDETARRAATSSTRNQPMLPVSVTVDWPMQALQQSCGFARLEGVGPPFLASAVGAGHSCQGRFYARWRQSASAQACLYCTYARRGVGGSGCGAPARLMRRGSKRPLGRESATSALSPRLPLLPSAHLAMPDGVVGSGVYAVDALRSGGSAGRPSLVTFRRRRAVGLLLRPRTPAMTQGMSVARQGPKVLGRATAEGCSVGRRGRQAGRGEMEPPPLVGGGGGAASRQQPTESATLRRQSVRRRGGDVKRARGARQASAK